MTKRKPQHGRGIPSSIYSIADLEMIASARRVGLAQAMEDMLSEPHRPDPRDASVEEPRRLPRLRDPFFAALSELGIVQRIAGLAQPPKDWRRQEFITKVRNLIWVATVKDSVRRRASATLDIDNMKKALVELFRARDALHRLSGLIDSAPIDAMIGDLSLWLGTNPKRGAGVGRGRPTGSYNAGVFKWFVLELRSIAHSFGAELTLSKLGSEPRGTLVEVLDLLRPHLACIPKAPPYRTLERLWR
jgi:hypothetical protein